MDIQKTHLMRALFLTFWIISGFHTTTVAAQPALNDGLFVIVNVENSIDRMTASQLSRIFSKKVKKFENNLPSLPVAQKPSRDVTKLFNKVVLKKNAQQLKYYWARKMFSGSSKPPKSLASDLEVIKFVASVKNAVGYVRKKPDNKKVKVILIEP